MRCFAFALLAATALAAPAFAAPAPADPNMPKPAAEDPNMRTQVYCADCRTRIVGVIGTSTVITFCPAEQVKRVIFGDGGATWRGPGADEIQAAPLKNNLPLWPVKEGYTTLQVITTVPGEPDRAYQFAVRAKAPPAACEGVCDDPAATYGLRFLYPEEERRAREAERDAKREAAKAQAAVRASQAEEGRARLRRVAARGRLRVDNFYGGPLRNWLYEARGDRGLAPDEVSDNGQETTFLYRGQRRLPAFFIVTPDGQEQSILPTIRADMAVLPVTARQIRLRLGGLVLDVFNRGHDPAGVNYGTYTTSPDVVRQVRRADGR